MCVAHFLLRGEEGGATVGERAAAALALMANVVNV
jgi:hypothetical protein